MNPGDYNIENRHNSSRLGMRYRFSGLEVPAQVGSMQTPVDLEILSYKRMINLIKHL
jgi:hypothetical protein